MPLLTEGPPKGVEKVLGAAVSELVGHGALALGTRSRPAVSMPVRAYNLGADAIAAGKGLAAAQPTGWLVTLSADGEARGTIELVPSKPARKGETPSTAVRFGGFSTGPLHRELAAAIDTASKDAGRSKVHLAVLRAPALYLLALWLRDDHGDRLVPISPSPPPLKAGESYPADRALNSLQKAAKRVLEGDTARN
jgi:hypothetical protein